MIRRILRKPLTWAVLALIVVGGAFGLYWFQPWKLVVDARVEEALSTTAPALPGPVVDTPSPAGSTPPSSSPPAAAPGPAVLAEGAFVTQEHDTSGTARIVRLADGALRLELVNLSTSNGPDLRVWLSDQAIIPGREGWSTLDDGKYHELGRLKGNKGNQVYAIPAGLDISQFRTVSIWCKRFAVSFGAAPLSAA